MEYSQGRLLSTMLAAIAEFQRELIRERTREGGRRAQALQPRRPM
jgi:DNA invertase Pin-like site-specific DNA recombinase